MMTSIKICNVKLILIILLLLLCTQIFGQSYGNTLATGICTTDRLRIRSLPNLGSETIGHLMTDEKVGILERSSWQEEIDGIGAYWLKISNEEISGWAFGGYIQVSESEFRKIRISSVDQLIESTLNFERISDLSAYPVLPMKIFGFEVPREIPSISIRHIAYDDMNKELLLVNFDIPEKSLKITAVDPTGKHKFYKTIPADKIRIIDSDEYGNKLENQVIIPVDFNQLSFYDSGFWNFSILIDDEVSNTDIICRIETATASVSEEEKPSPFEDFGSVTAKKGDTIYFCINSNHFKTNLDFVLYRIDYTSQNEDLSFNLYPQLAAECETDESGRFVLEVNLGNDIPSGDYKVAYGKEITDIITFGPFVKIE